MSDDYWITVKDGGSWTASRYLGEGVIHKVDEGLAPTVAIATQAAREACDRDYQDRHVPVHQFTYDPTTGTLTEGRGTSTGAPQTQGGDI